MAARRVAASRTTRPATWARARPRQC
jgi:hypothetical protein